MANHKKADHHLNAALTANKQQNPKLARHHIGHALNALNDRVSGSGFAGSPKPPVAPVAEGGDPDGADSVQPVAQAKAPMPFASTGAQPAPPSGLVARLRSFSTKKPTP